MRRYLYLFIVIFMLSLTQGCGRWSAHINLSDVVYTTDGPDRKCFKDYQVGEKKTSYIGQDLLRYRMCTPERYIKEVVSPNDLVINATGRSEFIIKSEKNSIYPISNSVIFDKSSWSTINGEKYHLVKLRGSDDNDWNLLMSQDGSFITFGLHSDGYNLIFFPSKMSVLPENFKFVVHTDIKEVPRGTYELIFSGKNDVSLNTTYKEFTADNLARPAFFQNLTYQANANQFRFKEFVIQVHDVSNESITYSILEDGTK